MMHLQLLEIAIAELLASDDKLTETAVRLTGGTANDAAQAVAAVGTEVFWQLVKRMRARFFDTAKGDDLTRLVVSEFGVPRWGATAAETSLTLSRTGIAPEVTLDQGFVWETADGVRFSFDDAVYWADGDTGSKVVAVTAIELGPGGNVEANTITRSVTALPDTNITATNPTRAAGGNDAELDDPYRARVRDIFARWVRGTLQAIILGALEVPEVRTASAYETLDSNGEQSGSVVLTVADAAGNANSDMVDKVLLELVNWRAAGIYVLTDALVKDLLDISMTAYWAPGYATSANKGKLIQAVVARVNKLKGRAAAADADPEQIPLDCQFRHALLHEAAATIQGCLGVVPDEPVGTVVPSYGHVLRTDPGRVVVN